MPRRDFAPLPAHALTGRKLGTAVLFYVLGVIGVITLEPFHFEVPARLAFMLWDDYNWLDPFANVVLFVPPGFLYALARSATRTPDARGQTIRAATALGLIASACIEITQIFEPTRYPSPLDVATNTLGAALGAWAFTRAARRLGADSPLVQRLGLELPLMGLVYLLVPLLSLAALTVEGGAVLPGAHVPLPRGWGLVVLALFGGALLGHVQRHHFGPSRTLAARQTALAAAGWFAVGALPALATAPRVFLAGTVTAALAAWAHGRPGDTAELANRRFETEALSRSVSWLAAYLVLLPLTEPLTRPVPLGKLDVLHAVESLAAFTVLGYVLAEAWGRLELRYRYTAWRVGLVAAAAAVASEGLRRMAVPTIGGVPSVALHVLAAAYGGWIYHLQRAHVRALVASRTMRREPSQVLAAA
jgi:glycopeptide antibiotics resistance protein